MGRRSSQVIFLFMASLFTEHSCLQWSQETHQANIIYVCSGGTLTLPWNVDVNAGGTIVDAQWLHSGRSEEIIAVLVHGSFMPMPAYSGRVRQTTNAGIRLEHVTVADSGNYSVEILGRDSVSATVKRLNATVMVHVADNLLTVDEHLHVRILPAAEYDNTTNQYDVVLSCGTFTYINRPPFEVSWLTPSGRVLTSSRYQDGNFYLTLSSPVEGGLYTCRVPAASACLHDDRTGEATVILDMVAAELAVVKAELTVVKADLAAEKAQLRLLEQRVSFSAQLFEDFCPGGGSACNSQVPLVLPKVVTNVGNGYNATTGRFVAPVNGVYCFMASTETSSASNYTALRLFKSNGDRIAFVSMKDENHYGTGSLHAITHLTVKESVYLTAVGGLFHMTTAFSGFLIASDP